MSFVNSAAGVLFVLLAVPLALYALAMPRRRVRIPSIMLWRRTVEERLKRTSRQWLRRLVSLLLQLAILTLLILACGRPILSGSSAVGGRAVILLDDSASMSAREGPGSRFDVARERALSLVSSAGADARILLITLGGRARIATGFTRDCAGRSKLLSTMSCTDGTTDLAGGLRLALRAIGGRTDVPIFVISDGAADLPELTSFKWDVRFLRVGTSLENVGITACHLRRGPDNPEDVQIAATVTNNSSENREVPLKITVAGEVLDETALSVPAGNSATHVFKGRTRAEGIARLELSVEDALSADDLAFLVLPGGGKVPVLLVSDGDDAYIESALRANLRVESYRVSTGDYKPANSLAVNILNRFVPAQLPAGHLLVVNSADAGPLYETAGTVRRPVITDWDRGHPILAGVNLDDLVIEHTLRVKTPAWASVLARAGEVPLVLAGEFQHRKVAILAFGPDASNLPLRAAFPLLVENAVRWMSEEHELSAATIDVGGSLVVTPASPGLTEIEITDPAGVVQTVTVREGRAVFTGTRRAGGYAVTLGSRQLPFAVCSPDAVESDLTVRNALEIAGRSYPAQRGDAASSQHLWVLCALAALLLLAVEWVLYHRRMTV